MSEELTKLLEHEVHRAMAAVEPISLTEVQGRGPVELTDEPEAVAFVRSGREPSESFEWLVDVSELRSEVKEHPMNRSSKFAAVVVGAAAVLIFAVASMGDDPWSRASDQSTVGDVDIENWDRIEHDGLAWARVPDNAPPAGSVGNGSSTTSPAVPGLLGSSHMESITVGGPGLVAVGTDYHLSLGTRPYVWTSPDGLEWRRSTLDPAVFGDSIEDQVQLKAVIAGGPGVVAVGSSGDLGQPPVWTSSDGLHWQNAEGGFDLESQPRLESVTIGGPGLVAVGWVTEAGATNAAVWTSEDGLWWSRVTHDPDELGGPGRQVMLSVTEGGPGLVAVGQDQRDDDQVPVAAVWTSTDGRSWLRVPHDESVFGGSTALTATTVTEGGPGLIAAGFESPSNGNNARPSTASLWTSADGLAWHRLPPEDEKVFAEAFVVHVAPFESGFIAVGQDTSNQRGKVWTSRDGLHWCPTPHDPALFEATGITAGVTYDSRFIAVGTGYRIEWGAAVWVASLTESGFTPCEENTFGDK